MDLHWRPLFNHAFSPGLYQRYHDELSNRLGTPIGFRLAESPVFFPEDLRSRMILAAHEIAGQLQDPDRLGHMKRAIPLRWDTPGMDVASAFLQIDFAVCRDQSGELIPRLIELQGFPSLTAFQVIQRDVWNEILQSVPGMDGPWSCWFSGLDRARFLQLARDTILADHDPETVILMDLEPESQKTYVDFVATAILLGIDAVCPTRLVRKGDTLWRYRNGDGGILVPVRRIYNRVVFDELERRGSELPFDYRQPLSVEWAPHPNWFWAWSKYSLPFLDHPAVPRTVFLSELEAVPPDLERRYVLKPLFSFAGTGVRIQPTEADLRQIPDHRRGDWCLQEKTHYEPALLSTDGGGVKVEIRMMFLRPDRSSQLVLAQNLCRLSRGEMLGVDFNKDMTWVGSSVGLWPMSARE